METFIFIIHLLSCIFLIGIILLQRGQGANIGAAFGGASQTVFGSRGPATFLNKLTVIVAVVFLAASVFLAQAARHHETKTVVDEVKKTSQQQLTPAIEPQPTPAEETKGTAPVVPTNEENKNPAPEKQQ